MTTETLSHQREAAFHDAWANSTSLGDVLVRECFEAPTALENQFILSRMGPLSGKKLLDIGAGLGESSVYFALQGSNVTVVDISPQMVATALDLGRKFGVQLEGVVASAENLNLTANTYDIVYAANTIHHVQDRAALFQQLRRALKPGGMFFSYDPLAYNPLINIYRRMATAVRTTDEAPLTVAQWPAEQLVHWHTQGPGLQVEQGVLDRPDRLLHHPTRRRAPQCLEQRHVRLERAGILADQSRRQRIDGRRHAHATKRLVVFAPANQPVVGRDLQKVKRPPATVGVQGLDLSDLHSSPVTCFGIHMSSTAGAPSRTAWSPRWIAGPTSPGSVTFSPYAPLAAASPE